MIAVLAKNAEHPIVKEFFELFKTPWEFYRSDRQYEVLICADAPLPDNAAKLVLIYGPEQKPFDRERGIDIHSRSSNAVLSYKGHRIPIYGTCLTFRAPGVHRLTDEETRQPAALEIVSNGQKLVRIGFDLFQEVLHLLTRGQPAMHAEIPALEIHIALLRDLIVGCSICLIEIPPVPAGYGFIVCLTHDVDHVGVRNHKCDHTMFGFLYRATIGSVINFCRGRSVLGQLAANWAAALSLPFVYLGIAKDFWYQFDRYLEIEKGLTSTFFVIPHKGDPGEDGNGRRPAMRAARYGAADISDHLRQLLSASREIGVHGIDAWRDASKGREELERVSHITGASECGVRMHWLFFDEHSPAALENAGFSYDSTVGYNGAVGYRAGTTQVFKPLGVQRMLELPLHIMDTALFFPAHMNLSPRHAKNVVDALVKNAIRFGGVLTVNWHDRSIAPERLWDGFYIKLLDDLRSKAPWFPTATQTIAWFKKRRSAAIENVSWQNDSFRLKASLNPDDRVPGLRIRIYNAPAQSSLMEPKPPADFIDVPFNSNIELVL